MRAAHATQTAGQADLASADLHVRALLSQVDVAVTVLPRMRSRLHVDRNEQEERKLMATIEETFEGLVRYMQRAMESQCPLCDGTVQRTEFVEKRHPCGPCEGMGKWWIGGNEQDCELCHGAGEYTLPEPITVACECGDGTARVARNDVNLVSCILGACISGMHRAREEGNFDYVNRILDWAMRYCLDNAAVATEQAKQNPGTVEELLRRFQRAGTFTPADFGSKLTGGALTEEELEALLAEADST